jgi:rhodanese-related sulfurtransferase
MNSEASLKSLVAAAKERIREITVHDVLARLGNSHARLLDVREAAEYFKGSAGNALHIPRGLLEAKADREYEGRHPALQDRSQELMLICKSGARSALAAASLLQMGFTNVVSVAGGFDAWVKEGLPLVVPDSCTY